MEQGVDAMRDMDLVVGRRVARLMPAFLLRVVVLEMYFLPDHIETVNLVEDVQPTHYKHRRVRRGLK